MANLQAFSGAIAGPWRFTPTGDAAFAARDLTTATVQFRVGSRSLSATYIEIVSPDEQMTVGASYVDVQLETETIALLPSSGTYRFELEFVFADARIIPETDGAGTLTLANTLPNA